MGSCNQEIDVSAGTLVWVRRRNGHWWPARVVGLDELPASCLKLRKAGTPIKLLGSEDGSMDWYNLEKSKRVKAFRCGEYDDIIEKAKNCALRANRRSINERKYVRREDAILHALELEKTCYFDGNHKVDSVVSNAMITSDKIFGLQSTRPTKKAVYLGGAPSSFEKSRQELSQSVVSFEHTDECAARGMHFVQRKPRRTPNESVDDAGEGMKSMRDLEDLGLRMVTRSEQNVHIPRKGSSDLDIPDNASLPESDSDNDFSGVSPTNSSKDSTSSFKRKESQVLACENMKYGSHRCSLVGSTNKRKANSICYRGDIGGQSILQRLKMNVRGQKSTLEKPNIPSVVVDSPNSSGTSCEENMFDTNERKYNLAIGQSGIHSEMKDHQYPSKLQPFGNGLSDGCISLPVVTGVESASGLAPAPTTFRPCPASKDPSNHYVQVGDPHSNGSATRINHVRQKIDSGLSDWYLKGKRNLKYLTLSKNADPCLFHRTQKDITSDTTDESPLSDTSGQLRKCVLLSEVGNLSEDRIFHENEVLDEEQHGSVGSDLYDIELNVRTSYQSNRVPLVSLMSNLTGQAIVGHPVAVEVLESGLGHVTKVRYPSFVKKSKNKGKKTGFSPRKIRRLSSFAVDRKKEDRRRSAVVEKIGGRPIVSCIPLRLVFSRLNEALSNSARGASGKANSRH